MALSQFLILLISINACIILLTRTDQIMTLQNARRHSCTCHVQWNGIDTNDTKSKTRTTTSTVSHASQNTNGIQSAVSLTARPIELLSLYKLRVGAPISPEYPAFVVLTANTTD
eukprot:309675_1